MIISTAIKASSNVRYAYQRSSAVLLRFFGVLLITSILSFAPKDFAYAQFEHPVALAATVVGDEETSRIIIDFDRRIEALPQLLEHPWRLVLDFDRIGFGFEPKPTSWSGFAQDIRWGDMSEISSRMIFEMDRPFNILKIENIDNAATQTHRIVIDLKAASADEFRSAMLDNIRTSAVVQQSTKSDRLGAEVKSLGRSDRFIVVLDPGHGGIDSGAVGKKRTLEKDITLAFSRKLKAELELFDGIEVQMTRDSDIFIPLNDRVRFARQSGASLFISIHADSVKEKHVRGATIYTISEKASDSVAAQIADSENRADAIAGLTFEDEPEDVSDILIDLARRETLGFSVQFARLAVESIEEDLRMIRNPHRHAGFRVLRAPDVPSVLIELGFLSNEADEKLLKDPDWRLKAASRVAKAIERFAVMSGHQNIARQASE